ncbi:hypothetical protein SAY86_017423 [Trapa natans]|uniref:AAA+ ATPase domain-containing protein n=1 Tax=Trapa natans TaxID=22666 RepID=A0AAN7LRA7_TRANT|nr:hypothetical protein SAY86_017423 [Trapa natans]
MISVTEMMGSPSSLFSAYASIMASTMLFRSILNDLLPKPVGSFLVNVFHRLFKCKTNKLTLVIDEFYNGIARNQIFDAVEVYLSTRIGPNVDRLKIDNCSNKKRISIRLEKNEKLTDTYQAIELDWKFLSVEQESNGGQQRDISTGSAYGNTWRSFELSFQKRHKETILTSYLPFIQERANELKKKERVLKMYTLGGLRSGRSYGVSWDAINLDHPSTFATLAMEAEQKTAVIADLDRFLTRKEFYKRVGRAWKRGYLLYGPPGTGKSSLVAAMANYLKFDVYDLQLSNVAADSDLRDLLLGIGNRSILVIEDIDCSIDLPDRQRAGEESSGKNSNTRPQLTLSGLLNFIDGLWSTCGNQRVIIFTTNHVEKLDPALLRPGRMDMHIHMSYCSFHGFKILAENYLGISEADLVRCHAGVLAEIESLIAGSEVTPAEVAEEFMKSEDPHVTLDGLVKFLSNRKTKTKKTEENGGMVRAEESEMANKSTEDM